MAGALVFGAVGANARGGGGTGHGGPGCFIGIVGCPVGDGSTGGPSAFQEGGYQADTGHEFGHIRRRRLGGYGGYGYDGYGSYGGYYRGY